MTDIASPAYLDAPLQHLVIGGMARSFRGTGLANKDHDLPIVLLHGIGSNARSWAGQFAGFADRCVIAWNAPGYAGSDALPLAWPQAQDYAQALAALLDRLEITRCCLIGQSLGAIIAAAFARTWPARIAALMLASPATGYAAPRREPLPANVAARVEELHQLGPDGLAEKRSGRLLTSRASAAARALVRQAMSEVTHEGYQAASRLLATSDITQDGAQLTVPTIVVWGSEDVITPPAGCRRVAQAIPGAQAIEVPNLGHGFATEAPATFNAVVQTLLELPKRS